MCVRVCVYVYVCVRVCVREKDQVCVVYVCVCVCVDTCEHATAQIVCDTPEKEAHHTDG